MAFVDAAPFNCILLTSQVETAKPALADASLWIVIGRMAGVWATPHLLITVWRTVAKPANLPAGVGVNSTSVSEIIFNCPELAGTTSQTTELYSLAIVASIKTSSSVSQINVGPVVIADVGFGYTSTSTELTFLHPVAVIVSSKI